MRSSQQAGPFLATPAKAVARVGFERDAVARCDRVRRPQRVRSAGAGEAGSLMCCDPAGAIGRPPPSLDGAVLPIVVPEEPNADLAEVIDGRPELPRLAVLRG